jgi:undecaprenyl-diphosphatase
LKRKIGFLGISVIEFIVTTAIFLISVLLFSFIAQEVVIEKDNHFDTIVFNHITSYDSPFFTSAAKFITNFGSGYFLIPAYLVIILYHIRNNKKQEAVVIGIVALVSLVSGWLLKDIFHRPRPLLPLVSGAGGYSFPSGHSLGGFTFSGVLIYLLWRTSLRPYQKWILSVLLLMFSLLIGLSRIYLRVHFASDVLGSFLVTVVWLSLTFILQKNIRSAA